MSLLPPHFNNTLRRLVEARRKKSNEYMEKRKPKAKRVKPGGAPILADVVAFVFSKGSRGALAEDVAIVFKAAPRTMRKWRAQLRDLRFAKYSETLEADGKVRMFLKGWG